MTKKSGLISSYHGVRKAQKKAFKAGVSRKELFKIAVKEAPFFRKFRKK